MSRSLALLLPLLLLFALLPAPANDPLPSAAFAALVDDYYAKLFDWDPVQATYAGVHDRDDKLADLSAAAVAERVKTLKAFQKQIAGYLNREDVGKVVEAEATDAIVLDHAIRAELLELEVVRDWKRNPVLYLGKPAEGIDLLMKRSYAEPAERLRAINGRLKAAPALLKAMQENVEHSPKEFLDLALIVAKGSAGFFRTDLPAWAKKAAGDDQQLLAEFLEANARVLNEFDAVTKWVVVKQELKETVGFSIGADAFAKKLAAEEMLDIPLAKLLAIGETNLKRDQEAFVATAKKIDPNKTPHEVLALLTEDHPKPEKLVEATRATIEQTRRFLIDKKIVTVPSEVRPTIAETPSFMRTGSFASMDTPGAFETKATEAFYYVTPPEADWDAKRKTEHLRQFNKTTLEVITIHEAYPGHYLQFLYAKQYPTKVRKLYTCGTNVEGWAHYAEQMIVDEGYGNGDPRVRLAQLQEALLRDCRYVVGIKLHTEGWTVEQGKKFFVEQGYVEPEVGFQEARRGTYNPTYLYYTLGKLQILKLREDYKKARGAAFTLREFHDAFVKQGGLPIPLIRRILLPGDTSPSL